MGSIVMLWMQGKFYRHKTEFHPHTNMYVCCDFCVGWVGASCAGMHVSVAVSCEFVCVHVCVRLCTFVYVRARFCTFARVLVRLYACLCLLVCTCAFVFEPRPFPGLHRAKAALNMMTRTCAQDLRTRSIFMTSVDTGWINDENPLEKAASHAAAANFQVRVYAFMLEE